MLQVNNTDDYLYLLLYLLRYFLISFPSVQSQQTLLQLLVLLQQSLNARPITFIVFFFLRRLQRTKFWRLTFTLLPFIFFYYRLQSLYLLLILSLPMLYFGLIVFQFPANNRIHHLKFFHLFLIFPFYQFFLFS